jgi:hypothetical protein
MSATAERREVSDELLCAAVEAAIEYWARWSDDGYTLASTLDFLCGSTPRTVARLRRAARAGLVERVTARNGGAGWRLTPAGEALAQEAEPPCRDCVERPGTEDADGWRVCAPCLADWLDEQADGEDALVAHYVSLLPEETERTCLFVMLNPSTADETTNDPTITRCIGFARDWGYGALAVGNLFALRSTDPAALADHPDPLGPYNWHWLTRLAVEADVVVAAWGASAIAATRAVTTLALLARHSASGVRCLGLTKDGHPRHPLYVRADAEPVPYVLREAA